MSATTVLDWLLDSDPSIRWQVQRDLLDAPASLLAATRARVATDGWGVQLLAAQRDDGTWGGVAWNRGFDSTMHVLILLRELGLDPASESAQRALARVRTQVTWRGCGPGETEHHRFFEGEVEPCINAQVAMVGAYFGEDVAPLIDRLLGEQLADGGWNCDAERGSTRSSFHTTSCVLEALLEFERSAGARADVGESRQRATEYLLERRLMRRRSTGELVVDRKRNGADWQRFAFPTWWHYDILRGLDVLRMAGVASDGRLEEAVARVAGQRGADGRWVTGVQHAGNMLVALDDGVGAPSRWITLRAMRVLRAFATVRP
ncbi:MAG: hypothetical protein IT359_10115 [Gemmatimonadaceae bacterium]|nr:hypothetical protein [Gemmatimonadaceae bacterium]